MINLKDLLALGGRLHGPARAERFSDWSYDSRLTKAGQLFIALRIPRADGHDYIADALLAGATGLLCSYPPADPGGATLILADDPIGLLQRWATECLRQVAPQVVAVTGSLGKTTTRQAIGTLLAAHGETFTSRDSFNTALGLPVALARLGDDTRYAVLEFASDYPGEIARLAALFPPQLAVITNVADVHSRAFVSGFSRLTGATATPAPMTAPPRNPLNPLMPHPLNPLMPHPLNPLLVRGQRAPIVGRICMDYLMVDVTHIAGVRRGDAVVLIGAQGDQQISADEVASWIGTINYEVVTGILPRVPREIEG